MPSVAAGQPFLWEVSGPRGSVVMFGTYHAAGEGDVPRAAWNALERASVFVAEADERPADERASGEVRAYLHLPPGVLLSRLLGEDDFRRLASLLRDLIPADTLQHMKPWVAMFLLTKAAFDFPSPNISAALLARARSLDRNTEFFDTLADQARFLDASAGTIKLREAIDKAPHIRCGLTRRVEAFRAGDDLYFTSDIPDAGDPIVARLERWYEQVDRYLNTGERAFIAIGSANLLGPYGMLAKLRANGYEVRRLTH